MMFKYTSRQFTQLILFFLLLLLLACKADQTDQPKSQGETVIEESDPVISGITMMLNKNTSSHELYHKRGELLYQRERYNEAEQDLKKAIELKEDLPAYYHLLADIQLDGAQSRDAIKTMEMAIEKFPTRIPSYLKLSEFYLILKQYDKSLGTINEIIRIDPQNADAYFMLGLNFRDMGDTIKSLNSLQRSVEIDADMVDAWILLGNIYEQKKDPIAVKYYENAVESDPENIEAMHSLAYFLQNDEKISEAINIYDKILNINPKYEDAHLNAGILNLTIDSLETALMHFNLLVGLSPANSQAREYRDLVTEMIKS